MEVGGVAEVGEDFVVVLAEGGGSEAHLVGLWGSGEVDWLSDDGDFAALGVRGLAGDAEVFDLLVFEGSGDVVDRSAGDAGLVEALDPVLGSVGAGALVDGFVEGGSVLRASDGGGVVGMVDQLLRPRWLGRVWRT